MSYARFSEGDVYVYGTGDGRICCCTCTLRPSTRPNNLLGLDDFNAKDAQEMLAHLGEHMARGESVPDDCLERLREEAESASPPSPAERTRADSLR